MRVSQLPSLRHRALRTVATWGLLTAAGGLLRWAAGSPTTAWHDIGGTLVSGNFDRLLADAAALVAWALLGWSVAVLALEMAVSAPGWLGRAAATIAAAVNPPLIRRIAHAAIGLTVAIGPLTAGSAFAAGSSPAPGSSAPVAASGQWPVSETSPASQPAPVWVPLDRPATAPSLRLDRPAQAFLPAPPPPARRVTPTGPITVVAGAAHREEPIDSYVVRRGDTLWDVAARHLGPSASAADVARDWPRWYAANRAVIGADPSVIRPGELLRPPPG
jgi:resuscitation-promoting factor RpfA